MEEIEVIRRTRSFLNANGLCGHRVLDLYTDAHPSIQCIGLQSSPEYGTRKRKL